MTRHLPAILIACFAIAPAHAVEAQDQEQPFKLTVKSHLVVLPVTVRNSKGELMQTLSKDDFELTEDGRPQTIKYFDLEKDKPLSLGLLVDMSGSVRNFVKKEHAASDVFFNAMLQKNEDTAFLVRFDSAVTMLQPPTNSQDDLHAALEKLEEPHLPQRAFTEPPGAKPLPPPGTLLYDSIVVVCDLVTKDIPGRKALVILTDGEDSGSQKSLAAAIEATQRTDTVVYTILYTNRGGGKDPAYFPGAAHLASEKPKLMGEAVLELLSSTTGGHEYEVSSALPLEAIYAQIAEEMRMQYTLAYIPAKSDAKPGYRKIELKTKLKGMNIQTRFGYYAKE